MKAYRRMRLFLKTIETLCTAAVSAALIYYLWMLLPVVTKLIQEWQQ